MRPAIVPADSSTRMFRTIVSSTTSRQDRAGDHVAGMLGSPRAEVKYS
jgi:hypothetical protein